MKKRYNQYGTGGRITVSDDKSGESVQVLDVPDELVATTMHIIAPDIMSDRWLKYFLGGYKPLTDEQDKELINNRSKAALFMQEMLLRRKPREHRAEFYLERLIDIFNLLHYKEIWEKEMITCEMSDEEMKEYDTIRGYVVIDPDELWKYQPEIAEYVKKNIIGPSGGDIDVKFIVEKKDEEKKNKK